MASDKAIKTRQSILDAAKAIIIEEGIGALTMERAATKAGISKGACMYHFKSKRALQAALVEEYAAHLSSELARHEALFTDLPRKRSFRASSNGSAALIMTTTAGRRLGSPSIPISCTTKNSCVLSDSGTRDCMLELRLYPKMFEHQHLWPSWLSRDSFIRINSKLTSSHPS